MKMEKELVFFRRSSVPPRGRGIEKKTIKGCGEHFPPLNASLLLRVNGTSLVNRNACNTSITTGMWHRVFGQWWRAINGVPANCTYVGVGDSLNGERASERAGVACAKERPKQIVQLYC